MKVISKSRTLQDEEHILFGGVDIQIPNIDSEETRKRILNLYFKSYAQDVDLSPNFRAFLRMKLKRTFKSRDFAEECGDSWTLVVGFSDFEKNEQQSKFYIDHNEFLSYLREGLVPQINEVSKIFKKIERGESINRKTTDKIVNLLNNNVFIEQLSRSNSKDLESFAKKLSMNKNSSKALNEKMLSGFREGTAKNITNQAKEMLVKGGSEHQWQTFFMKNKSFFFFGSSIVTREFNMEDSINKHIHKRSADFLITNQFGLPRIIELKKPAFILFAWDGSHNKFVPTSKLSSAISQTQNYLRAFANDEKKCATKAGIQKGFSPLVEGMVIYGTYKTLFNMSPTLKKAMAKNGWVNKDLEDMAMMELHTLNYNQKNLSVITFDQFVEETKQKYKESE